LNPKSKEKKLTKEKFEFAKKWVSALRSGMYRQGRRSMYDPVRDCYCCLGVACAVANPELTGSRLIEKYWKANPDLACTTFLPVEVEKMLPLHPITLGDFAGMNDNGESFLEIADKIEERLEKEKGALNVDFSA